MYDKKQSRKNLQDTTIQLYLDLSSSIPFILFNPFFFGVFK